MRLETRAEQAPRLLAVAHGTASAVGVRTIEVIVAAVAKERPGVPVSHCYLDVLGPRLPDALDDAPTVAVPLLLSTGYHVQSDIPGAVAAHPGTVVARHLGPDERLTAVLLERLGPLPANASVLLVGAGSTRPEARDELSAAADLLSRRSGRPVTMATMSDDLAAAVAALAPPVHIATYLLTEGAFVDRIRAAAPAAAVAEPLGVHPRIVELIWARYDDAAAEFGPSRVR